jgi:hypothetical protein
MLRFANRLQIGTLAEVKAILGMSMRSIQRTTNIFSAAQLNKACSSTFSTLRNGTNMQSQTFLLQVALLWWKLGLK